MIADPLDSESILASVLAGDGVPTFRAKDAWHHTEVLLRLGYLCPTSSRSSQLRVLKPVQLALPEHGVWELKTDETLEFVYRDKAVYAYHRWYTRITGYRTSIVRLTE